MWITSRPERLIWPVDIEEADMLERNYCFKKHQTSLLASKSRELIQILSKDGFFGDRRVQKLYGWLARHLTAPKNRFFLVTFVDNDNVNTCLLVCLFFRCYLATYFHSYFERTYNARATTRNQNGNDQLGGGNQDG